MTEKKLLEKYNAVRQQLENAGRQIMNLKSQIAGMRDQLDSRPSCTEHTHVLTCACGARMRSEFNPTSTTPTDNHES